MTDAIRILHAADFHLDSSFAGLTPQRASLRRSEQRELMCQVFELAKKEKTQVILLAGDLFDSDNAYFETTDLLRTLCAESDARIFISPGNHDYYSQTSPYGAMVWPDNVHIFRSPRISAVEIHELDLRVYGAAFNRPNCTSLMDGFTALSDHMTSLMVMHGERGGSGAYNTITDEQIISSGLDYLALGHTHSFSGILSLGSTAYAYPGCPEGRGFDETGPKGVILGTVRKGETDLRFVQTGHREYRIIETDLTGCEDIMDAVLQSLPDNAQADICRLILTGQTTEAPKLTELNAALTDRFFGLEIKDRTARLSSLWDGEHEQTLRGEFLTRMRRRWSAAPDEEQREQIELAVKFGLAALDRREEPRA